MTDFRRGLYSLPFASPSPHHVINLIHDVLTDVDVIRHETLPRLGVALGLVGAVEESERFFEGAVWVLEVEDEAVLLLLVVQIAALGRVQTAYAERLEAPLVMTASRRNARSLGDSSL